MLYSQDSEFLFRLAMLTGFCYVNLPLVLFDRSPAEIRHVGVSAEWNKEDFFLHDSQLRLEGLLRLGDGLPVKVRKLIRAQLGSVHSGWTNWYLEKEQYGKAREAVSRAAQLDLTLNVAAKWLLTWMTPRLALRSVRQRREREKRFIYGMRSASVSEPKRVAGREDGPRPSDHGPGACPVCGQDGAKEWLRGPDRFHGRQDEYTLVRCPACSLVWLSNPPEPSEMHLHYTDAYDRLISASGQNSPQSLAGAQSGPNAVQAVRSAPGHGLQFGSLPGIAEGRGLEACMASRCPQTARKLRRQRAVRRCLWEIFWKRRSGANRLT